jgi:hypothetical protein
MCDKSKEINSIINAKNEIKKNTPNEVFSKPLKSFIDLFWYK